MFQFKRILMNAADASGGGGGNSAPAPAPADATTNVPQAQGAAITMTQEQLTATVAGAVSKAVADAKDSIYAEARRTFTAPAKTKTKSDDAPPASTSPASQPDVSKLRRLDRAINSTGVKLSDFAYEIAEREWQSAPDDAVATDWVKGFADRLGIASAPPPVVAAPATSTVTPATPARNAAPVSDRGSPPVSAVALEDQNVIAMSPTDREALRKLKGDKWFTDRVLADSKGQTIKLR